MSAHTPGPWTMQPIGDETECNILGAGRELIATVSDNDARLIAAAPRMLEWLEAFTIDYCPNAAELAKYRAKARAILRDVEDHNNG